MVLPITNPASVRFASRYRNANGINGLFGVRGMFRWAVAGAAILFGVIFLFTMLSVPGMPPVTDSIATGVEPVVRRPTPSDVQKDGPVPPPPIQPPSRDRQRGDDTIRSAVNAPAERKLAASQRTRRGPAAMPQRSVGQRQVTGNRPRSQPRSRSQVPIQPPPHRAPDFLRRGDAPPPPPPPIIPVLREEVQEVYDPPVEADAGLLVAPSQLPAEFRDPVDDAPPPIQEEAPPVVLQQPVDVPRDVPRVKRETVAAREAAVPSEKGIKLPEAHEYATGADMRFHTPFVPTHAFRVDAGVDVYRMNTPTLSHGPAKFPVLAAQPERQDAIREAFMHSWRPYVEYAWGRDTLKPISKSSDDSFLHMGISITDSLDTMLIMGLREEYAQGVDWVVKQLKFNHQRGINTFESTIRVLGGLLAAWDLDGRSNDALLDQARAAGDALAVAFDTTTGIPHSTLDLSSRSGYNPGGGSSISEVATLQLEWEWLSYATGEPRYALLARRVMMHLQTIESGADSLYGMYISPDTGVIGSSTITLGARGDSLYEYLLKQYLLAGGLRGATAIAGNEVLIRAGTKTTEYAPLHGAAHAAWASTAAMPVYACADAVLDSCAGGSGSSGAYAHADAPVTAESEVSYWRSILGMYWRSMAGVEAKLWRTSHGPGKYAYIAERHGEGAYDDKMDHLVCFVPGMLALGAAVAPTRELAEHHVKLAADIMRTCVHMYEQTATHLAAEITRVYGGGDPSPDLGAKHNLLRPETVESLLIMYRVTGDVKWREAGWDIFRAFNTTSRVPDGGFTTIHDVTVMPPQPRDVQESFWLAETLKYLYLLFSDSDTIPLDKYVFNTEAHPLRVFEQSN